jgi:hypothetical protein
MSAAQRIRKHRNREGYSFLGVRPRPAKSQGRDLAEKRTTGQYGAMTELHGQPPGAAMEYSSRVIASLAELSRLKKEERPEWDSRTCALYACRLRSQAAFGAANVSVL